MNENDSATPVHTASSPAEAAGGSTPDVRLTCGGLNRVRFEADGAALAPSGDAVPCLGLVPVMTLGLDLRNDADMDEELLDHAREIRTPPCSRHARRRVAVPAGDRLTFPSREAASPSRGIDFFRTPTRWGESSSPDFAR